MEVSYPGFVVRRGCGELSTECSPSGSVQVIATDPVQDMGRVRIFDAG
jgi:hypothetical protein